MALPLLPEPIANCYYRLMLQSLFVLPRLSALGLRAREAPIKRHSDHWVDEARRLLDLLCDPSLHDLHITRYRDESPRPFHPLTRSHPHCPPFVQHQERECGTEEGMEATNLSI